MTTVHNRSVAVAVLLEEVKRGYSLVVAEHYKISEFCNVVMDYVSVLNQNLNHAHFW